MMTACNRKKQRINPDKLPTGHDLTYLVDYSIVVMEKVQS
jgi:hypothetical protein